MDTEKDTYLDSENRPDDAARANFFSRHRGVWYGLAVVVAIVFVLIFTCPQPSAHRTALSQLTSEVANDIVAERVGSSLASFGTAALASSLTDKLFDQLFSVHDYMLFSTCEFRLGEKHPTVSVGVLGHVFTINSDRLENMIREEVEKLNPNR